MVHARASGTRRTQTTAQLDQSFARFRRQFFRMCLIIRHLPRRQSFSPTHFPSMAMRVFLDCANCLILGIFNSAIVVFSTSVLSLLNALIPDFGRGFGFLICFSEAPKRFG